MNRHTQSRHRLANCAPWSKVQAKPNDSKNPSLEVIFRAIINDGTYGASEWHVHDISNPQRANTIFLLGFNPDLEIRTESEYQ